MLKKVMSLSLSLVLAMSLIPIFMFSSLAAYENTYQNTGNQRIDIVGVAKTQVGYKEGANNNNKYGAWYGQNNVSWCAHFVVWCARQANVPSSIIAATGWACADDLKVPYYSRGSYTPKSGDLIFFNYPDTTATWDHVGIVESVNTAGGTVTTIEGNASDAVKRNTYNLSNTSIRGYGVPNYQDNSAPPIDVKINRKLAEQGPGYSWEQAALVSTFYTEKQYYMWYRLFDANTDKNLNAVAAVNYKLEMQFIKPNGTVQFSHQYSKSDVNWIGTTFTSPGKYTCRWILTGDYYGTYDTVIDVVVAKSTIAYDANGGTGAPSSQTGNYGSTIIVSNTIPKRTGYTFKGWATDSKATTPQVQPGGTINCNVNKNSTVTLYAIWSPNTYTVSYNANGGTGAPSSQSKTHGTALTLSSTKPTRTGYTFLGWSTSSSATSATYTAGGSYTANAAATLYAVWKANVCTVTFNYNGSGREDVVKEHDYGTTTLLNSSPPTRVGYTCLGWATSKTATAATHQLGTSFTVTGNITLYAVWLPNTYTISYNANGGSGAPSSQSKTHGTALTLSATKPTRSGYTFLGWSTSSGATTATYSASGSFTADANTTLYAVWSANTYTISYNANGGSGAPSSQSKTHGTTLTLSATKPTRSGYTFLGWSTSSGATTATYSASGSFTADANTTLYAVWSLIPHTHSYTQSVTASTCTAQGYTTYSCSCGDSYKSNYKAALGHSYGAWNTTKQPTESATGRKERVCSACGNKETENLPMLGHTHSHSQTTTAPTCTAQGYTSYTCSCGDGYKSDYTAALGHGGGTATCTAQATCTRCNAKYGSLLEHKEKAAVTKATSAKDGKTDTVCSVCNKELKASVGIPKASSITLSAATYTYDGKEKKPAVTVKDSKGKTLKNGTDYTVTYPAGCKNIGAYNVKVTFKGNYSGTVTKTFKINPKATTGVKATKAATSIKLTWTAQSGVEGYQIYDTAQKKVVATVKGANTNSVTISNLTSGKAYSYQVRAFKTVSGTTYYGAYSAVLKTSTLPATPAVTSVTSPKAKNLTVKWSKIASATGYEIQYSTDKNFKSGITAKTVNANGTVSATYTGLAAGKTYYVRIRTYKTIDGAKVYSPYATAKSVKIK